MNIVDRMDALEVLRTEYGGLPEMVKLQHLTTELLEENKRLVALVYDLEKQIEYSYGEDDFERAYQDGYDDGVEEQKEVTKNELKEMKAELRILRKENKDVLKTRIETLKRDIERLRSGHEVETNKVRLENEKMLNWGKALRLSLNEQSTNFYRDMNRMISEIKRLKKLSRSVRVVTLDKNRINHNDTDIDISKIKKRWLQIDTAHTKK